MTTPDSVPAPEPRMFKRYLKIGFGVLAVGLLGAAVYSQKDDFFDAVSRLSWTTVLLALLAALLATGSNMMSWRGAMRGVDVDFPLGLSSRVFFISQLGKYVPGSVWPVLAQIELTKDRGIPRARSATGALVGMAVGVVTSALVSTVLLLTTARDALGTYWFVLVIVPVGLISLTPPVLAKILSLVGRIARRDLATTQLSWAGLGSSVAWSFLMWVCFGAHSWLIVRDLIPDDVPSYGLMLAAFAFAWLAGFLVIVAPAGVGVREAVFVLALGGALTVPDALALAILSRFLLTIVDALVGGVALVLTPGRIGRGAASSLDRSAP